MKCPVCETEVSDFDSICPNCQIQLYDNNIDKESNHSYGKESKNADRLEIIANINLFIIILAVIYYFYEGFTNEAVYIIIGIGLLLSGLTIYFVLKTIVDIFDRVDNL